MPRFKLKRLSLFALIICSLVLIFNIWIGFNESLKSSNLDLENEFKLKINSTVQSATNKLLKLGEITRNYQINLLRGKPWFMNGNETPKIFEKELRLALWPEESPDNDRIINQLMYLPPNYTQIKRSKNLKNILIYFGINKWDQLVTGQQKFLDDNCPVNTCSLTVDKPKASKADAIIFMNNFEWPKHRRKTNQVWILYLLESPLHTDWVRNYNSDMINWTASYRLDSDIVAPYEKFVSYNNNLLRSGEKRNYAKGKSKKVGWFVSNCGSKNARLEYAQELSKYIDVDIYGSCGTKICSRKDSQKCMEMLYKDYKFYLAFENSNCRDYITEKFYINGLGGNSKNDGLIPIVMGAHPHDYDRSSPHHSYIQVDDFDSVKSLAEYLHILDKNDTLYNQYFEWKFSGEFINTYFWCRVCALLHAPPKPSRNYKDISKWWRNDICSDGYKNWINDSLYITLDSKISNSNSTFLIIYFAIILILLKSLIIYLLIKHFKHYR